LRDNPDLRAQLVALDRDVGAGRLAPLAAVETMAEAMGLSRREPMR
jgi:hypothetical protein